MNLNFYSFRRWTTLQEMALKWHVLKVDFNRTMHVAGIATQSRSVDEPVFQQWVTQYFVYYSLDCVNFTPFFNEGLEEMVNYLRITFYIIPMFVVSC